MKQTINKKIRTGKIRCPVCKEFYVAKVKLVKGVGYIANPPQCEKCNRRNVNE